MQVEIGITRRLQHSAKVFKSSPRAIHIGILTWLEEVSEMEVLPHEECNVDGSDSKEEPSPISFHALD